MTDYWRRDPLLHYTLVADRITRDHYRELLQYPHFADNDTLVSHRSPGYDRLGKVRPVINLTCRISLQSSTNHTAKSQSMRQ